jgi:hypothetical protein
MTTNLKIRISEPRGCEVDGKHYAIVAAIRFDWRVNTSKFLLTVCVFGLLLSSAFAEEKSPEQYREERSHIFGIEGLENQTLTRVVASGAKQRIGFYASLNPDCSGTGDINVRVTKQPEHGTVETVATTGYAHWSKENTRSKCSQHKVKGM